MAVFEITNTTDDEMYFPLGIFNTLEDAKTELAKFDEAKEAVADGSDEHEEITVFKREFGWTEHGSIALKIDREMYQAEKGGDWFWRTIAD